MPRHPTACSLLLLIPLALASGTALAQGDETLRTLTTVLQADAVAAKGEHLRGQVAEVSALMVARQFDQAARKAAEIRLAYEQDFDPALRQYSFQSLAEFQEFSQTSTVPFEWIDWGYRDCLQAQAFIAAERRDFATALDLLRDLEALAPLSASTVGERGYVLNQLGHAEDGLAAYRRAYALATRYESQRPVAALALRGMGYSLIELHRWDEAERVLLGSLEIEPGNRIAVHELDYLRRMRPAR